MTTHRAFQSLCVVVLVCGVMMAAAPQTHAQRLGQLYAAVTDGAGQPVANLVPESFRIEEDGAVMTILSAHAGTTPMKIAILVDNSEMITSLNAIPSLRTGLTEFLNRLPPQHEVALYSVGGSPLELLGFTSDRDALRNAADGVFPTTGGVRMMEGMFDTWERRFDRTEAWPVVFLVLTDGPETSSNINEDQVNALVVDLIMNGATVHAVLLQNQLGGQAGGFQTQAAPFLAETTGGLVRMVNTAPLMAEAVAEFGTLIGDHFDEMATRYRITYERPSDTPGAQVRVGVIGGFQVRPFADRKLLDRAAMPRIVTAEAFGGVEEGMTYAQVVEIVGAEGTAIGQSTLAGTTTVLYQWANPDSSNMSAMFQNDALIGKTQAGL